VRRALALGVLLAALPGCDLFADDAPPPAAPPAEDRSPVPGQPPIGWVSGQLQEIAEDRITLRVPAGSRVRLQRLSGGTTRFLVREGDAWRELTAEEAGSVQAGQEACAEVLLDGSNLAALRIFLDAGCGPIGGAP